MAGSKLIWKHRATPGDDRTGLLGMNADDAAALVENGDAQYTDRGERLKPRSKELGEAQNKSLRKRRTKRAPASE